MIKKNLFFYIKPVSGYLDLFSSTFVFMSIFITILITVSECYFKYKSVAFLKRLSDRTTLFDMMLFVNLRSEKLFSSKLKPYQIVSFYLLTCVSQPNMFIQVICLQCMINFSYAFRHDVDKQSTFLFW